MELFFTERNLKVLFIYVSSENEENIVKSSRIDGEI